MTAAPPPTPEPPPSPEPDLSGTTLDRYSLLRRLGVGGMGAVYEVEHVQLHKRFALKMLREELAQNELFRHRFLREARAASAVSHPHVVDISDFGETPSGRVFFVMELLEGRDLSELLEAEGRLSWPRTQEILLQVTSALETAHRQGVIHRDIKPSNCFLVDVPGASDEVFVKVLDFGIAKLSGSRAQGTMKLTSTQEIFGTVAYMAPEMAQGINDDHRSDIYALGVMMYQMLVGELPFTEGNAFQILSQHVSASPPRPRDKQPSIPEGVEAIILKAMAKNPDERFSSMQEFGRALRHGSLDVPESAGGQTTMLHITPIGRTPSGGVKVLDKTTPLPSSGPHAAPSPGAVASSGSHALGGGDAAAVPQRVEPTVVSPPIVTGSSRAATPERVEPTVVSSPIVTGSSGTHKRSLAWLVLPALGVVGAIGAGVFFITRDSNEEQPAVVASQTEPEADERQPLASPPPVPAPVPAPAPVPKLELPEAPAVAVEPEPSPAEEPADHEPAPEPIDRVPDGVADEPVAPIELTPPDDHPTPPKPKPKPKPKTDAQVVAALQAKILAKCKYTGGTAVRIEGLISSTGKVASLLITPSTGPGACAKKIVMAAKFDPTKGVRPIPRFSVAP